MLDCQNAIAFNVHVDLLAFLSVLTGIDFDKNGQFVINSICLCSAVHYTIPTSTAKGICKPFSGLLLEFDCSF